MMACIEFCRRPLVPSLFLVTGASGELGRDCGLPEPL